MQSPETSYFAADCRKHASAEGVPRCVSSCHTTILRRWENQFRICGRHCTYGILGHARGCHWGICEIGITASPRRGIQWQEETSRSKLFLLVSPTSALTWLPRFLEIDHLSSQRRRVRSIRMNCVWFIPSFVIGHVTHLDSRDIFVSTELLQSSGIVGIPGNVRDFQQMAMIWNNSSSLFLTICMYNYV